MSDVIRRFVFAKHYGATAVELRHDKGTTSMELVSQWPREVVDAARKSLEKPDPAAIDVVAEIVEEAQAYADALNAPVLFQIRVMRDDIVKASRPYRVAPKAAAAVTAVDEEKKMLLEAVLKSNTQLREYTEGQAKNVAGMMTALNSVLEAVAKQKIEAATPVVEPVHVLSDEEKEELLARSAILKEAAGKLPDGLDLLFAGLAKWLKIGDEDPGMAVAAAAVKSIAGGVTEGTPTAGNA